VVAARHVLCEKQGKINEAYKKLQDGWLDNGDKVPPAEFAKVIDRLISDRDIRASVSLLRLV
jgi:NIMA-interacting peptidyl-prolyl cis-trans isomerase 4